MLNVRENVPLEMAEVQVRLMKGNLSAWFAVKKFSGVFEKKYFGSKVRAYCIC